MNIEKQVLAFLSERNGAAKEVSLLHIITGRQKGPFDQNLDLVSSAVQSMIFARKINRLQDETGTYFLHINLTN